MITISPVGLSTTALVANQVSLNATYSERLCNRYCNCCSISPQSAITYTYGSPTLVGSTVFVPVIAVISVVTSDCCGCATTKLYNESFEVAFQGQTTLPTTITIASVGKTQQLENTCKASYINIYDSLTITIS